MRAIYSVLFLVLLCPALLAKQQAPFDISMHLDSKRKVGELLEYDVRVELKPFIQSDQVTLMMKTPKGFQLVNGFSQWQGDIERDRPFIRNFTFQAKNDQKGVLEFIIQIKANGANHAEVMKFSLSNDITLGKSTVGSRKKGERRKQRHGSSLGGISRY